MNQRNIAGRSIIALLSVVIGATACSSNPSSTTTEVTLGVSVSEPDEVIDADESGSSNSSTEGNADGQTSAGNEADDSETDREPRNGSELDSDSAANPAIDEDSLLTASATGPVFDGRPLPASAIELGKALSEVEMALRSEGLALAGDDGTASVLGPRQQQLYRLLALNPAWEDEAVAQVDPTVADAVSLNWEARQALSTLVGTHKLSDTLPAWKIVDPAPATELIDLYQQASDQTGVPWEVLAAINLVETRMGRIRGLSTAGAVGPMQFLPSTWEECCEGDPSTNSDAIRGAAIYLVNRGAESNLDRAILGYNNSEHYVTAIKAYAAVLEADESAYHGYHAWDVLFLTSAGLLQLPDGYLQNEPVDAADWLDENPDRLFPGSS